MCGLESDMALRQRLLISPATANEPMIDVLFYFVTFVNVFSSLCIGFMYNK